MPISPAAIEPISQGIGAGVSLLGGWLQRRAAQKAAEEQRRAGTAAADRLAMAADGSANRISESGTAAASALENAGGAAQAGITEAGRIGSEQMAGALQRFNPYSEAGLSALERLQRGIGEGGEFSQQFNGSTDGFRDDAGLAFRIGQGTRAIRSRDASLGLIGGNTAQAINDYAQGQGSDEYDRAYNRSRTTFQTNRENALNPLTALIGTGERANTAILGGNTNLANFGVDNARMVGGIGLETAQGAGDYRTGATRTAEGVRMDAERQGADLRTGAAAAGAAGTIGGANAWSDALSGVARSTDFSSLLRPRPRTPARPNLGVEPAYNTDRLPRTVR